MGWTMDMLDNWKWVTLSESSGIPKSATLWWRLNLSPRRLISFSSLKEA